ncbi:ABC transporter G family member 10-like [Mangifera indica]|uniref:ABC transporter G family member 10-like n=1 Tax=Mangifera indica TaxID=29780 RepID=UPI001CFAE495|nr:ABC transporter G family member 10-like [Mangifera indica]
MELPVKAPVSNDRKAFSRLETKNLSYKLCSNFDEYLSRVAYCGGVSKRGPNKFILEDVSVEARPGEITAIAGPSGAGKTTLLEILAGKISLQNMAGQVLVNGRPMVVSCFRKISGYVTQDDALFPLLTVEETLMFSALLRLPGGRKEAATRVRVLLKELGLDHIASSKIGEGSSCGISGGERRRVSIGVDLVHDPAVVLIDEPTSGLDSASALHIVTLLKSMAVNQGKTIVLTLHQPGFRILELFDRLVLLSNGFVVHNGTLNLLEKRLKTAGHYLPRHVNVLEFAIDVIETLVPRIPATQNNHQCHLQSKNDKEDNLEKGLPIFLQERRILMREISRGAYRVSSYVLANTLIFIPFLLMVSLLFTIPVYWLVGLKRDIDGFLYFSLVVWMVLLMSNSFVACFSALVPNFIMGTSVIAGLMGSFFLFSGYFISKNSIPNYWIFMHYLSLFKYPYECFMINEYGGKEGKTRCLEVQHGECSLYGSEFLKQQDLTQSKKWINLTVMLSFIIGYRILCFSILWFRCYRTRN